MRSGLAGILVRWLLPALLAAAVLGMHHLPATVHDEPAGAHHEVAGAPGVVAGGGAVPADRTLPDRPLPPVSSDGDSPGGHAGHELLHLCLAVLTVLAGLVSALFVAAGGWFGPAPASAIPRPPGVCARPPPVSRRLAALGVLRL